MHGWSSPAPSLWGDPRVDGPPSLVAQPAKPPNESTGVGTVRLAFPFAQREDTPALGSAGGEADRRRRMSTMTTAAGEKGELSLHGCGAAALPMGMNSISPAGASSMASQFSLDSWVDAFRVYISAAFVFPEEKMAISSMMEALAKYTQARLRAQQHFSECEACLHQFAQLQNGVVAAAAKGSVPLSLGNTKDTFTFQSQANAVSPTFNTANMQRGRAKVDMDLAECRQTLQKVEAFASIFQDFQRRRRRLLEVLEEEKQQLLLPPLPQRHSGGAFMPIVTAPVFQLQTTLEDGISQLYKQWDMHIATKAEGIICRLNGTHSQEDGDVSGSKEGGELADSTHLITLLLKMCDDTLGRVETMRSRISRLGSIRIDEAESIEKLLANMDNYDPTAEEHMGRRKQIDAELEELRSWLTHIGQLRQRAMNTKELLQQCLTSGNRSTAGSKQTSPCAHLRSEGGGAPSSLRPSLGGPTSLDEWRQALVMPDAGAANKMDANPVVNATTAGITTATATTTANNGNGNNNDHAAPVFTSEDGTLTVCSQRPSSSTASDNVKNEENATEINPMNFSLPEPPMSAVSVEGNGRNTIAEDACRGGLAVSFPAHGAEDRHSETGVPFRYSKKNSDDDDDVASSFHANAFDEDDFCGSGGRWHRRRKRSAARGYLGGIAAFARAVVHRATQFSDSECSSPSDSERVTEVRRRRRVE
ncbi:hypothetical protein C3747_78g198 [Trypanosoma cruzi]|uniref:Uncharacterized protein n=3 Tax=Trypanosoma cruzi TaxID=5693 RepID=Q4E5L8_TRYCC|nr:hypothetical protein, conserved [Trypanosoma cruzi]EAO00113.1 hypothetical protein, conserved [Trypanosoma cruzi]PWV09487.1 hypothetical protein C3747_78g198 [Trypanosoma cruzi]RNC52802.1 hypothetical protein TcCL_ESM09923 [Trypanosoma cruzi]|eukprot:XP_821964.1 hypothetical protein [Trypanosoma cruzi strain CL Brener]